VSAGKGKVTQLYLLNDGSLARACQTCTSNLCRKAIVYTRTGSVWKLVLPKRSSKIICHHNILTSTRPWWTSRAKGGKTGCFFDGHSAFQLAVCRQRLV